MRAEKRGASDIHLLDLQIPNIGTHGFDSADVDLLELYGFNCRTAVSSLGGVILVRVDICCCEVVLSLGEEGISREGRDVSGCEVVLCLCKGGIPLVDMSCCAVVLDLGVFGLSLGVVDGACR